MTGAAGRTPGRVDHLWVRVADVAAARAAGRSEPALRPGDIDREDWVQFRWDGGSISYVLGDPPTSGEHIAFA